jgi:hypothetical protein
MIDFLQNTERRKFPTIEEGPMWWSDVARSCSIIRLKRKMINEFCLDKKKKLGYRVESWKSFEEIERRISDIKKSNEAMPILLFIHENDG